MGGCASRPKWLKAHDDAHEPPLEDPKSQEPAAHVTSVEGVDEVGSKEAWHVDETNRRSLGALFHEDDELKSLKHGNQEETEAVIVLVMEGKELKEQSDDRSLIEAEKKVGGDVSAEKQIIEEQPKDEEPVTSEKITQEEQHETKNSAAEGEVKPVEKTFLEEQTAKMVDSDRAKLEPVETLSFKGVEESAREVVVAPLVLANESGEQSVQSAESGAPKNLSAGDQTVKIEPPKEVPSSTPIIAAVSETVIVEVQQVAKDAKVDEAAKAENLEKKTKDAVAGQKEE